MKDQERDIIRKTILELLNDGHKHYTTLDKKLCATIHSFATTHTFRSQFHYLLNNGYVTKISRGTYQITPKGKKYLDHLKI